MSFINERCAIIRRSNKDMFYIYLGSDGLYYNYYDAKGYIVHRDILINDMNLDFSRYSFSLDKNDNLYCIYCNNYLQILECRANSFIFTKEESITYNYKKFGLAFPYIKYIDDNFHIFYYVFNNNSANTCALFHHYKQNTHWIENKIDFINYIVLDNFYVLWSESVPTIFYFNLVNGCEEIFSSRFNLGTFTWSEPIQITKTGKNKLYLGCIKDNINFYHFCFCEYQDNGYVVKYINGYLCENKFDLKTSSYLSNPSTCMYPSLIKTDSTLYISWVNFNKLFTSTSKDLGKTWSQASIDDFSKEDKFIRSIFCSNYEEDSKYNVSHVFSTLNDVGILGI
ncbi:hypothetical protein [Terrisporobacter sp.]